ncbi:MAG: hypothetical protein AABW45_01035 [Nanoarchaeota archaeon]
MKKSQTQSGSIAVLVILIALFMALYLLFLPAKDRAALLGQNDTPTNLTTTQAETSKTILLSQEPGLLKVFDKDTEKHEINAVNLFLKEEPEIIDLSNSVSITKSLFKENVQELKFSIRDLENLDKTTLFFLVNEGKGNLVITLNGIQVFNEDVDGLQNIVLPKDLLLDENKLTLKVSSPGINIFGRNKYVLSSIKVRENFELTNTKEERTFVLSSNELDEDAKLSFFLFCNKATTTRLRVFLNKEEITNELLSCSSSTKNIDLDKELLKEGRNSLLFEIDKGDYLINDVIVETKVAEGGAKTYKFPISEEQFEMILDDKEVTLKMEFSSTDENKKATMSVNGQEFTMDTKEFEFERPITSLVKEGNNFIKITPETEFDLEFLEIIIEK